MQHSVRWNADMRLLVKEAIDRAARLKVPADDARENEILRDDRLCRECHDPIPSDRPKNALYCAESCRQMHHRAYDNDRCRIKRAEARLIRLVF